VREVTRPFPEFRYFADPIAHGCVKPSGERCVCCGEASGFVYDASIYTYEEKQPGGNICPWCIADGTASAKYAAKYPASFNDAPTGEGRDEVNHRTPGIITWQGRPWPSCCGECCRFVGCPDGKTLVASGDKAAIDACLTELRGWWGDEADEAWLAEVTPMGDPGVYLFRCLRCDKYTAVVDAS
jgi:uncharacterized protein